MTSSPITNNNSLSATLNAVSPLLAQYTQDQIVQDLWHRPGLSTRDRALVTLSILVARNAVGALPYYFNKALDSGFKPAEISELMSHLAFYASWPYAVAAITVAKDIFAQRGIGADQLQEMSPPLLPIAEALPDEAGRVAYIQANIAPISPALQHFTDDLLYHEMWLRPCLAPRDRGLATVTALCAMGQFSFLPLYMNRAVLKGVTKEEVGEMLAHIAFYAGWGLAIEAAGIANGFFAKQAAA